MKIKAVYLKAPHRFPGDREPTSVLRAETPDGKQLYDIAFDAGFYWCRRMRPVVADGDGPTFRVHAGEAWCDEPAEPLAKTAVDEAAPAPPEPAEPPPAKKGAR